VSTTFSSSTGHDLRQGAHTARWLANGEQAFAALYAAIDGARQSIRFECYIIRPEGPAQELRARLLRALGRGVAVRLLYDAFGSEALPAGFFATLTDAGAEVRAFSPARSLRFAMRDHRKLFVADERVALLGGFNVGPEYTGDGVSQGWYDLGLCIEGPIGVQLARGFDAMFALAPMTPRALRQFRRAVRAASGDEPAPVAGPQTVPGAADARVTLLQSGLGWPHARLRRALHHDLAAAVEVRCMAAYFLPSSRIRRELSACHARGGRTRLLLAGRTDVRIARLASQHLYGRLLHGGAELYEYQPQILHAKLLLLDDVVYVGSCNLDRRSLHINYELLLRLRWPELAAQGRALFEAGVARGTAVQRADWGRRGWWQRARESLAYWLVSRVDPLLARRRMRSLG